MNSQQSTTVQTPPGKRWWSRLEEKWNEIQVGRQGSYSVERLESFDHYCRTTSRARVMMMCILSPLPALLVSILLECLPLRPVSEGWAANWVFWIRVGVTGIIGCFAEMSQLVLLVPELNPTFMKRQLVSWGASTLFIGTLLLVASQVGFPIPLMWYVKAFLMGVYVPAMILLVFGRKPFASTSPCRHNLHQYLHYFNAFVIILSVYPLYKVLYDWVPATNRGLVLIVLPIWRLAAKTLVVKAVRGLEDFMPEIVAMTVDFFSALFVCVCISTAVSTYLSALFILADIGQALLEFREVSANAKVVVELLRDRHVSSRNLKKTSSQRGNFPDTSNTFDLVALILAVTRDPNAFHISSLEDARLQACCPHPMTAEQADKLRVLQTSQIYGKSRSSSTFGPSQSLKKTRRRPRLPYRSMQVRSSAVAPTTSNLLSAASIPVIAGGEEELFSAVQISNTTLKHTHASGERSKRLVRQGLQLLFHCEYLVLVEYIECVVPLLYVAFKLVLEHLPNVVYYPGGAGNFGPAAVTSILLLAALEIASLLLLHAFIQRKLAFSPLYQLAFVLETQIYMVQAKFFIEIMLVLQYEIEHYGADFTFQFKWLHGNQ